MARYKYIIVLLYKIIRWLDINILLYSYIK